MLEGIQDYEKIRILRQSLPAASLAAFEDLLAKEFSPNVFTDEKNAAQRLNEGKKMLNKLAK